MDSRPHPVVPLDSGAALMNPEAQLEEAVCLAALHIAEPAARAQFLDRACAGDARLRAAVEAMLLANAEAENYFEQCRATVNVPNLDAQAAEGIKETGIQLDDLTDEQLGSQVGRYKLLQKIGEGGCGTVYLAEQKEPVRRQVALKVIKLGMDTKSVIARFEAERQALAMMDHPNIARVLDAGATETGRPFFVMELVRGTRITKYCDENNLNTAQRLGLFIQICRAIQHAHQKGVIHRDIKPSNILVTVHDGLPVPKVIDFGIAKATEGRLTDNTLFTAVEHFVGTPAYMSPEQADISGLDVDTRSDIYSLGVLLYELLTGRTPFDTKMLMQSGMDEMRRTLREKEPQLPSTMITSLRRTELTLAADQRHTEPPKLISQLKGDVDWIVMKALEKDRNRRYETANGLALDIQRYIDSEPVLARPPSQFYRLQKLVRRNKIVFAAAGAVAVALLIGLGTSTWLYLREREARLQESDARERETHLRAEAEDRAKITQAVMFVSQGQYDDADDALNHVRNFPPNPTLDGVSAFRSVGEWLALQGRWQPARERYSALIKIDQLDSLSQVIRDYQAFGVILAENGNLEQYGRFWQMAVTNFATNPNSSIVLACVLLPLDKSQIEQLKPMAAASEKQIQTVPKDRQSGWTFMPFGLWQYRCGNHDEAIQWCQRSLAQTNKFPCCDAADHAILAMAYYQKGQTSEACSELAQGRQLIDEKFKVGLDRGRAGAGYWFDWVYTRRLVQEAEALIHCDLEESATE
jgi:serine/threonine protein kinase